MNQPGLRQGFGVCLEADKRAESHTQIVVRPMIEIDLVSHVEAQADRAKMSFDATSRIEDAVNVAGTQILHRTGETGKAGGTGVQAEVDETALHGNEGTNRAVTEFESRSKQAMEDTQIGSLKTNRAARVRGCKAFGESPVEIISHFRFQLDTMAYRKTRAAAQANLVGVRLRDPEIVGEDPGLHVIQTLGRGPGYDATCQK
jgi:hypothetical protein